MTAAQFRAMHTGPGLLVLPNVWDAVSAQVFAAAGFPALATASSAIAATLGHADGEQTPREEMFAAITRIAAAVDVPVSADVEFGYRLGPAELVDRLLAAGVVGCNLEDTDPHSGRLVDAKEHADWLHEVSEAAGDALVINARVDVYLRGSDTAEAVRRARLYREAGADCIYPILAPASELAALVGAIDAPVNVHDGVEMPGFAELRELGIRRVTFGGRLHHEAVATLREQAAALGHRAGLAP